MSKNVDEKFRCTLEERDSWAAAARAEGVSRSEFIRRAANARADLTAVAKPVPVEELLTAEDIAVINEKFDIAFPPTTDGRRCPHGRRAGSFCPVCDRA